MQSFDYTVPKVEEADCPELYNISSSRTRYILMLADQDSFCIGVTTWGLLAMELGEKGLIKVINALHMGLTVWGPPADSDSDIAERPRIESSIVDGCGIDA